MKSKNPFYVLLLVSAVLFCITACSYCVMMLTRRAEAAYGAADQAGGIVGVLDKYGAALLAGSIAALAIFTVAAMATDDFWSRRAANRDSNDQE